MSGDVSPAVERAAGDAAARAGGTGPRLGDWLLALLADDEGRPAELVVRFGADVRRVRESLEVERGPAAPATGELYSAARNHALRLRGDPTLTTDVLLLAVARADAEFADLLAVHGIHHGDLEAALHRPDVVSLPVATGAAFELTDSAEHPDAARVVDANMNRARESLRVLDDYARFALGDAYLTGRLKDLRHRLAAATGHLPPGLLLAARDTPGDVGTAVSTVAERDRGSARRVAEVNFKRLQESLRSAEEYGKVLSAEFAGEVEQVRYLAYTLERVVLRGSDARERLAGANLYVMLTGSRCAAAMDWTIAEAAAGGAGIFQLREKNLSDADLLRRARDVRAWTRKAGVLFVMNDRPDIARLAEADGVHLGQDDLPVAAARRVVGPDALIGVSTHNIEQVRAAVRDGADYLGVGPTFPSTTKAFDDFPGLDFVRAAAAETGLPLFALGGIDGRNVAAVVAAGGRRVAVSAAILAADDPRAAAAQLSESLEFIG